MGLTQDLRNQTRSIISSARLNTLNPIQELLNTNLSIALNQ